MSTNLKYTHKLPKEEGYYYRRAHSRSTSVVYIRLENEEFIMSSVGPKFGYIEVGHPIKDFDTKINEWAGPLPEPEEN